MVSFSLAKDLLTVRMFIREAGTISSFNALRGDIPLGAATNKRVEIKYSQT